MSIVENEECVFVEEEETIIEENKSVEIEEAVEVTLKFYTSQSLTSNERCALLFNVSEPFKVSIHDFDHG
ncbi:21305_t:CDS:2 [Gigaspora margarita]|uniref:21305_t:CDS:1 n=1 Tax=Gigaspora margarita TaxID=4874 RepID=A0ABN7UHZ0_GIGMA|nr:21305_t:CDS:2 [Gigaspora margarita]